VVTGESPVIVIVSDDPALWGVGSPVTVVAEEKFPDVMGLVL
jgi:hypothetical protein